MSKLLNMANFYNSIEEKESAYGLFSYNKEVDNLLSNIKNYPHALLISFVVDDETDSGVAEEVPYSIKNAIGNLNINEISKIEYKKLIEIFEVNKITKNPKENAILVFNLISLLMANYDGDATKIWNDKPTSKELNKRLLEFKGINSRKANLFSLILVNKFKIKLADYSYINISYDRNIIKFMQEINLIDSNTSYEEIKYICKVLNPSFPGVFDSFFWAIGEYMLNADSNFKFKIKDDSLIKSCIDASIEII